MVDVGRLIDNEEQRDAIHVAIAPVIAAEDLNPGQHIGIIDLEMNLVGVTDSPIGIVDPFLKDKVLQDQEFWMFLYPNTVTSLKHEWTHPAFEAPEAPKLDLEYIESREWLENFAYGNDMTYDDLIRATDDFVDCGEYLSEGDKYMNSHVPEEFWGHFKTVTDKDVPEDLRHSFFSCSC